MRNFELAVDQLIEKIEPEGYEFNDSARSLATIALHDVELRYGENSEHPLPRHNAEHGLDVAGRAIELTNLLYDFIPEKYQDNIYELVILIGVSHDWEQLLAAGLNERASADYLISLIEKSGDKEINNEWFKTRAENGIMSTEYEIDDKGVINQLNLGRGKPELGDEPDPLEFIIGFADINGLAMEDEDFMSEELVRLFFEESIKKGEEPSEERLEKLVDYQEAFIRSQLNDYRIKSYIAHYFSHLEPAEEGENNPVYDEMYKAFNPTIRRIYDKAQWLRKTPGVIKGVEDTIHRMDVLGLSDKLGKIIKHGQ